MRWSVSSDGLNDPVRRAKMLAVSRRHSRTTRWVRMENGWLFSVTDTLRCVSECSPLQIDAGKVFTRRPVNAPKKVANSGQFWGCWADGKPVKKSLLGAGDGYFVFLWHSWVYWGSHAELHPTKVSGCRYLKLFRSGFELNPNSV